MQRSYAVELPFEAILELLSKDLSFVAFNLSTGACKIENRKLYSPSTQHPLVRIFCRCSGVIVANAYGRGSYPKPLMEDGGHGVSGQDVQGPAVEAFDRKRDNAIVQGRPFNSMV